MIAHRKRRPIPLEVNSRLFEERFGLAGGKGARQKVTLSSVTSHFSELLQLVLGLDAFSCHTQAKIMAEINDGLDNFGRSTRRLHALDEAPIDFETVEIECIEVAQG